MRFRLIFALALAIAVAAAACGSDDVSGPSPGSTAADTSSSPTATDPTSTDDTTATSTSQTSPPAAEPLTINELLDLRPSGSVSVQGALIDQGAGFILCEALAESFPPQCGGRWVVLLQADDIDVELQTQAGVTWADQHQEVDGSLVGQRFVVGDPGANLDPTPAEVEIVESFIAFASSGGDAATLPIAEQQLSLGLSSQLLLDRSVDELDDPDSWLVDLEAFRGWVGPFSALELLAQPRPTENLLGPHNHCAAPPVAAPSEVVNLRRISVSPTDATSCLEWWTVDFFIESDQVVAITLDLWEP